jgi:nucleoside-triphosphatase
VIDINNSENRKQLSRIDSKSGPKVGKYSVDIKSFESIAIPLISLNQTELKESSKTLIIVIDEIGKMEMFSDLFKRTVKQLFDSNIKIMATIPVQQNLELVQELRDRSDSKEIYVQRSNRDFLADNVVRMLCENAIK